MWRSVYMLKVSPRAVCQGGGLLLLFFPSDLWTERLGASTQTLARVLPLCLDVIYPPLVLLLCAWVEGFSSRIHEQQKGPRDPWSAGPTQSKQELWTGRKGRGCLLAWCTLCHGNQHGKVSLSQPCHLCSPLRRAVIIKTQANVWLVAAGWVAHWSVWSLCSIPDVGLDKIWLGY